MERPLFKPVGTPIEELDTPALVVDLDRLDHNLAVVHTFFNQQTVKLRPLVSAHCCPALAHRQLAAGGTVGGIATDTLGQAEVFAAHGFHDILVANIFVTPAKLQRLSALARQITLTVAVDHLQQVQRLTNMFNHNSSQVKLQVVIDINSSANRSGIVPGAPAIELARAVEQASPLTLTGLTTELDDTAQDGTAAPLAQRLEPLLDTRQTLEKAGHPVDIVSVGGVMSHDGIETLNGITELRLGRYALVDGYSAPAWPNLRPAARVLTTVTSCPELSMGITDTGQKAMGVDQGLPTIDDRPDIRVLGLSAEHCRLHLENRAQPLNPGDTLWLTPFDIGTCANLYDMLYGMRDGTLDLVWPISARGHYR